MAILELFDVAEACAKAEVTRRTIYKWIEGGFNFGDEFEREYLTAVRLGGKYYIDPNDLADFLNLREDFYAEVDQDDDDDDEG